MGLVVCSQDLVDVLETRIDWCSKYITTYFSSGGTLQSLLDKDKRSMEYHKHKSDDVVVGSTTSIFRCCSEVYELESDLRLHQARMREVLSSRQKLTQV